MLEIPFITTLKEWAIPISGLIAFISMLISFRNSKLQYAKKKLSHWILKDESLININEGIKKRIQISFDNQPVTGLTKINVKFLNSGIKEITKTDFSGDIRIKINQTDGDTFKLLATTIEDKTNIGVKCINAEEDNEVIISPILLNPKEGFLINLFIESYNKDFEVEVICRINGGISVNETLQGSKKIFNKFFNPGNITILSFALLGSVLIIRTSIFKMLVDWMENLFK